MANRDEGPVYYREIQKNAYLKRIPNEEGGKLRPLGHKKPPLKPMWTLFCVHNGRTPFLEQYPVAESPCTVAHRPTWRACLRAARHVTASVKPRLGEEYDFLVDTDHGPVRMLAPDWDTMQDWVTCLRQKLQELKILPKGENVYCAAPAAPPPRAAARDPTSPLPPTPPVPPDRVPGIELITPLQQPSLPAPAPVSAPEPGTETGNRPEPERVAPETEPVDISSWDTDYSSVPGTSQDTPPSREPKRSVAKICGQNICLDDSILKRSAGTTDSDDEFFAEIDRMHDDAESMFGEGSEDRGMQDVTNTSRSRSHNQTQNFSQENNYIIENSSSRDRALILDRSISLDNSTRVRNVQENSSRDGSMQDVISNNRNLTIDSVMQDGDSNKYERLDEVTHNNLKDKKLNAKLEKLKIEDGSRSDGFKQRVVVNEAKSGASTSAMGSPLNEHPSTNITVIQVSNKPPHTAIPVLGPETDVFDFEFKHNENKAQNTKNFINIVNTEVAVQNENGYGTVFSNESDYGHISLTTTVSLTGDGLTAAKSTDVNFGKVDLSRADVNVNLSRTDVNLATVESNLSSLVLHNKSNTSEVKVDSSGDVNLASDKSKVNLSSELARNVNLSNDSSRNMNLSNDNDGIYERLCLASTSSTNVDTKASPLPVKKLRSQEKPRKSSLPNLEPSSSDSTYEYLYPNSSTQNKVTSTNVTLNSNNNNTSNITITNSRNVDSSRSNVATNQELLRSNVTTNQELSRSNVTTNQELSRRNVTNENTRVHVSVTSTVSVGNTDLNTVNLRSNIERSHSQNAYDSTPRLRDHLIRRAQHHSPKREGKSEKCEQTQTKPMWKRGLTELSLLSRLRGIGHGRRQDCPAASDDRNLSGVKVTRRARPEQRGDSARRRSSSLSNGQPPPVPAHPLAVPPPLQSLRCRQAAALRADQRRGAAIPACVPASEIKVFVDYNKQVWMAWWGVAGSRCGGRAGDRVAALAGLAPRDATHARQLVKGAHTHMIDILFHRVPLAKIYVLNKRDLESIGIKLDNECCITDVEPGSPAARAGLPPPGQWALTEVNNRPINLVKGGEEEMNRMSVLGTEVSVLLQPAALVKKIRAALKTHRGALTHR